MPELLSLPGDLLVSVGHDFKAEWEGGYGLKFSLGPFPSEGDAERDASRLATALLWTCTSLDIAGRVDELRVERVPEGIEITTTGSAVLGWSGEVFQDELAAACDAPPPNPELAMSLALFNRAELESTIDLRFVTLVMALEVLAKPAAAQESVLAAVVHLRSELKKRKGSLRSEEYSSLKRRLEELEKESISQAIRRYARQALEEDYVPLDASTYRDLEHLISRAYDARSRIVHEGRTEHAVLDLHSELKRFLRSVYASAYGRRFRK